MTVQDRALVLPEKGGACVIAFWRRSPGDRSPLAEDLHGMLAGTTNSPASAAMLLALDGSRASLYLALPSVGAAAQAAEQLGRQYAPTELDAFTLRHSLGTGLSRTLQRGDVVALGEFWVEPGGLESLLEREPAAAQKAMSGSGILSANFHVSADERRVVNVAKVASAEAVSELAARPGFDAGSGYWRAFARNEHHTYEVTRTIGSGRPSDPGSAEASI